VNVPLGEKLQLTKFLAYGWSAQRSIPALRAQVDAALEGALRTGWDACSPSNDSSSTSSGPVRTSRSTVTPSYSRLSGSRCSTCAGRSPWRKPCDPGKGLTGPGYGGHAFWDTETFVLQQLTYTLPDAARYALRWRHSTLDKAKERARQLGLKGAAFPWLFHQR
jgi:alpha,alpha-trehalose phosphorylase